MALPQYAAAELLVHLDLNDHATNDGTLEAGGTTIADLAFYVNSGELAYDAGTFDFLKTVHDAATAGRLPAALRPEQHLAVPNG